MTNHIDAYPLQWPDGWPRTISHRRERSRFNISQDRVQRKLMEEIRRLGGRQPVLSTDLKLRNDGMPYASQKNPDDPGVAVYFTYKGNQMVFACDRWDLIRDNIHAIAKTIEALRGIERWGASDMIEKAFSGFAALPSPSESNYWKDVLEISPLCEGSRIDILEEAERKYKILRSKHHPDHGGDPEKFHQINKAIEHARNLLNG